jgi:hypothetical protein
MSSLKGRISEIEKTINRTSDLTVVRVHGGPDEGHLAAIAGPITLRPGESEPLDAFIDRAESAAIAAGQTRLTVFGLPYRGAH